MPRGKYMRKNKRNENALTTRLMQISLAMDDHIYCGSLITASEAGGYLQEIATLKLRCLPTNVRALQVIEKLTRCMRSIISEGTEHGQSFNESLQVSSEYVGSASPVYSLPDEDRTYYTDDQNSVENVNIPNSGDDELSKKHKTYLSHERENIIKAVNCSNYMATRAKSHDLSDPKRTIEDIEIIDITNASDADEPKDDDAVSIEPNVLIENVNTKMFNMAIEDETSFQVSVGDHDCSQSILDNNENENSNKVARGKGTVFEKESYNKIDAKVHVTKKVNNYFAQYTPTSELVNSQPTGLDLNVNDESAKKTQASSLKNKNKQIIRKKVANRKDEKVVTKKKSKYSVDKNEQTYQQNVRNTMIPNNTKNNKENVPKTVKKFTKRQNKKKAFGIYNENVENDLSWVENIRYVREISPDEHDPALSLLPDNFWDNFALPEKWNDLDFEY